ncbi:hypothetical protein E4U33_006457 [Claviceps sp. LM78 group G4]|nr:hypothetical protein E4U33_006457 [Claviceps sp. LM78 group G4]
MHSYVREISDKPWRPRRPRLRKLNGLREKQIEIFDEACDLFPPEHRAFDSEDHMRTTLDQRIRAIGHESTMTIFLLDDIGYLLKKILKELKAVDEDCAFFADGIDITSELDTLSLVTGVRKRCGIAAWNRNFCSSCTALHRLHQVVSSYVLI